MGGEPFATQFYSPLVGRQTDKLDRQPIRQTLKKQIELVDKSVNVVDLDIMLVSAFLGACKLRIFTWFWRHFDTASSVHQ